MVVRKNNLLKPVLVFFSTYIRRMVAGGHYGLLLLVVAMCSCRAGVHGLSGDMPEILISDSKGKKIAFTPADTSVFDFKNGYLCVVVTGTNQDMIQVNGINTDHLQVVYIRAGGETSFFSDKDRSRVRSKIITDGFKPGTPVRLYVRTRVYAADQYYRITINLKGIIPAETHVILNE